MKLSEADLELLSRNFTVDDPEALDGLVQRLPAGARFERLTAYNYRGHKVRCAHCHRALHYRGWAVDLVGGGRALIGLNCGTDAFGLDWDGAVADYNASQDRQLDIRRILRIAPLLPDLIAELKAIKASGAADAFPALIEVLRRRLGKVGQELAKISRDDGRMRVDHIVRDRQQEEDRARLGAPGLIDAIEAATTPSARKLARTRLDQWIDQWAKQERVEEVVIGRCAGVELFQPRTSMDCLDKALELGREAQSILEAGPDGGNLGAALRAVEAASEEASRALQIFSALDRFSQPDNLDLVAHWLNGGQAGNFVRAGRELSDARSKARFGLPADWRMPSMPALAQLKAAL
ncbi:MAG TPA: hypothetical protein VHZ26_09105 [Caulobacteraceae bacterium]|jgi:hypothetical protein|nr:hypothetical protein [Caulobacteraceae bacterium]